MLSHEVAKNLSKNKKAGRGAVMFLIQPFHLSAVTYFLWRAVKVVFPRRWASINPIPKSVNRMTAMIGVFTPVWASWRIAFTMTGVTGGMYELLNSGWVPVVLNML